MRSYEILDADGVLLTTVDLDDSMAPTLLAGQHARLVAVDGEPLAKESRGLIGAVGLGGELPRMGETFVTEEAEAAARAEARAARAAAAKSPSARKSPEGDFADLRDKAEGADAAAPETAPAARKKAGTARAADPE